VGFHGPVFVLPWPTEPKTPLKAAKKELAQKVQIWLVRMWIRVFNFKGVRNETFYAKGFYPD
jgi:hypothetical protein